MPVFWSTATYTRLTGPNVLKSSCKSGSRVSSDRLVTRTEFSSFLRLISVPLLSAPALMPGGTYVPLLGPEAVAVPSDAAGLSMNPSEGGARSLYGHLEVQWSPFLPQVLHTMRTAPPFPSWAKESPATFDSSALLPGRSSIDKSFKHTESILQHVKEEQRTSINQQESERWRLTILSVTPKRLKFKANYKFCMSIGGVPTLTLQTIYTEVYSMCLITLGGISFWAQENN